MSVSHAPVPGRFSFGAWRCCLSKHRELVRGPILGMKTLGSNSLSLTLLPWEHHFTLLGLCLLIWKMGIIILRISEGCEELNKMEGWKASQNLQNRTNLKSRDWNIQHQFINAPWKTADHHQVAFNQARPYSFTQVSSSRKASLVVHLDCKVLSPLSGHFLSTSLPQGLVQRVLHSEGLCALKPTTQASVVHAWLSHANR